MIFIKFMPIGLQKTSFFSIYLKFLKQVFVHFHKLIDQNLIFLMDLVLDFLLKAFILYDVQSFDGETI